MNPKSDEEWMEPGSYLLRHLRSKGVKLWSENGQLHYEAPKDVLTQGELEALRAAKRQISALLDRDSSSTMFASSRERVSRIRHAPLTLSQLSHWHWYRLGERTSIRQIASATRVCGQLNIGALRKSLAEIVCRHESLRTRIVVLDRIPVQEISAAIDCSLHIDDLSTCPEDTLDGEVTRRIETQVLKRIDVATDPLFEFRLLRLNSVEHVLVVSLEHSIADMSSINILLQDVLIAYKQASSGLEFSLPAIPVQFADYAILQQSERQSWIKRHGPYWDVRLAGCRRVRFPVDAGLPTESLIGWGTVPILIDEELTIELRKWCRHKRTTLAMSVFTAYAALVLRWCEVRDTVIQFVVDGRVAPNIANAVGNFAFLLSLRIELFERDLFTDLLNRVTDEYCRSYEHDDCAYVEAQVPRPEFVRNSGFNWFPQVSRSWLPQGSKERPTSLEESECAIVCSTVPFQHPILKDLERDTEPFILLGDADDRIVGAVHFPLNRFSIGTMEKFGRNLVVFIRALLERPERRVMDVVLG